KDGTYFDNAVAHLRLKKATEKYDKVNALSSNHESLKEIIKEGISDVRTIFNANHGGIVTGTSASQVMRHMTETVIKDVPGNNVVSTQGDHASSYDLVKEF